MSFLSVMETALAAGILDDCPNESDEKDDWANRKEDVTPDASGGVSGDAAHYRRIDESEANKSRNDEFAVMDQYNLAITVWDNKLQSAGLIALR